MPRQKIKISEERCIGCGLCVNACREGALALVDGKAKLIQADYCDGFGRCLPLCPTDAISFEDIPDCTSGGKTPPLHQSATKHVGDAALGVPPLEHAPSQPKQWPLQIQLVSPNAAFFQDAHLLVAADCAAFACPRFHEDYMQNRIVLIGCPKLDAADYAEKLTQIFTANNMQSVTAIRMEVPCCAGIVGTAEEALKRCGKTLPWQAITLSLDGRELDRQAHDAVYGRAMRAPTESLP